VHRRRRRGLSRWMPSWIRWLRSSLWPPAPTTSCPGRASPRGRSQAQVSRCCAVLLLFPFLAQEQTTDWPGCLPLALSFSCSLSFSWLPFLALCALPALLGLCCAPSPGFAISGRRRADERTRRGGPNLRPAAQTRIPKRYQASVVAVAHDCDLALLRIQRTQEDTAQPPPWIPLHP